MGAGLTAQRKVTLAHTMEAVARLSAPGQKALGQMAAVATEEALSHPAAAAKEPLSWPWQRRTLRTEFKKMLQSVTNL
ncbi:UNVERIFIED_CONTAM: hypothetical protein K2H54_033528 [Gekko kuhli]